LYATDYFETAVLNLARGISISAPATMYLALYLTDPGEDASGTEVSYATYARQPIAFSAPAAMGTGIGIQNTSDITFGEAATTVGSVKYVAVLDSLTGGNMWLYGELDEALSIVSGVAPIIRAGGVKWYGQGKMSNAYRTKIFNTLRGINCPGFTPYLALCNGSPEEGGAEFSGNSYARTAITFSSPAAQSNGGMLITNSAQITTPQATGTWGALTKIAVYDAASSGTPYMIDDASIQTTVTSGSVIAFKTNTLNFYIN
jgi:hypothetical protein